MLETKRITVYDIAGKLKVSHTTVCRALRNHPSISVERRKQVQEAAEQMGYRPDPLMSALSAYRQKNGPAKFQSVIAWVNHWNEPERLRGEYKEFEAYWHGASLAADRLGYRLDDTRWPADCSAKRFERVLLARGVRGLIIPPHVQEAHWGGFDWGKFSVIRFGMSVPVPDSNFVTADHSRALIMAVGQIKQYGYHRIGLIVGDDLDKRTMGSYSGSFKFTQRTMNLNPALGTLFTDYGDHSQNDLEKQKVKLQKWLLKWLPDAILTTDSEVPNMIRDLGFRIPQDIGVAGTSVLDIPVDAGIDQQSEQIGRIALEMLVKQINLNELGEPPTPCRILIESRWKNGRCLPLRRDH